MFVWEDDLYYSCTTCDVEFHKDCYSEPKKLIHPYHLQHPLDLIDGKNEAESSKCTWCGSNPTRYYYRCSICSFCLDIYCSYKFPSLTITNPKSHHHLLSLFPRPLLVPCDACGSINRSDPSYACFQCNYMVHVSCINLPRVIKLTRHHHRLSHTPYLSPSSYSCRVCHKNVDDKYGQYSCNQETCSYVAHSKCASHKEVWDGRELEWEPEEPDNSENVAPFKKIGDSLIEHFCHEHHLRLEKYKDLGDDDQEDKQCHACVLPIDSRDFYNCTQCGFSLHEVCANLPRELDHALHKHKLFLDTSPQEVYDDMSCSVCQQRFSGFRYKCKDKNCLLSDIFRIHVGCISLPDYFTHKSHGHPLCFPILELRHKEKIICKVCKKHCSLSHLQCSTTCEFDLCYRCATFPSEVRYKHDKHPLSLCYGEETSDGNKYWCDICEKELDSTEWFYTCDKCCVTIHLDCIFGSSIYMKPGFTFRYISFKVKVLRNNSNTRLICDGCEHRCSAHVYYEVHWYRYEFVSCSLECLEQRINGCLGKIRKRKLSL
ncbi:unnamed protein product [Thlaspi arvense]|uniref:Zinc finger PHD-type domain-containing protein n=1 Tax=Thlaspi arvense TaxID=13288 RepID=A0AAU9RSG6_THLAR|nr:unnamed protein product [Thlaspi arvense]